MSIILNSSSEMPWWKEPSKEQWKAWIAAWRDGHDYVVIGRLAALDASFATIMNDLATAFGRVHADRHGARHTHRSAGEAVR